MEKSCVARAVLVSIVSQVAQGYFTLRQLDLRRAIAQRTLVAREESLRLTRIQEQIGVVSMLDVRQAEQLVYTAATVITEAEREIERQPHIYTEEAGLGDTNDPERHAVDREASADHFSRPFEAALPSAGGTPRTSNALPLVKAPLTSCFGPLGARSN